MNKFGTVLGVAALVTLAGCKDPDYKYANGSSVQDEVKYAEAEPAKPAAPAVDVVATPEVKCKCLPGTKHTQPCACGAADCKCVIDIPPAPAPAPAPVVKPAAPQPAPKAPGTGYGIYIVQKGDVISKIAVRYGVKSADIRTANPRIKRDIIWPGMKLRIPGKADVLPPAVEAPKAGKSGAARAAAIKAPVKKVHTPYTGATKLYTVKAGDSIGTIAYSNGLTIRQFKELNGLKKDVVRVGQKLKIPTQKVVAPVAAKPVAKKVEAEKKPEAVKAPETAPAPAAEKPQEEPAPAAEAPKPAATESVEAPAAPAPAAAPSATYVVQEGDDMTGVSIRWGVSAAAIRELNNLADDAQLVPGQILKLPADAQQ